mmetsp:Transcript_12323/g.14742  ORF Transcript_12323/g.14742 Transcript_12323/m.14742 type:complete len:167 (+) Transcript_12323:965-1465(+)|eukprot:CAMPEP_0197857334 /NCGR_PEP_ID=MMETSP1438-20131217/30282_1 /TAXON_ID=1461541 /ORGANISM="Pterosperma sp., Strain CCMP1384" /LENGTH=166 /DNA_ID=CAMNT_0043473133 /DNA_START=965 /DNA_END=1465 /DNA_ORIENTATION=+
MPTQKLLKWLNGQVYNFNLCHERGQEQRKADTVELILDFACFFTIDLEGFQDGRFSRSIAALVRISLSEVKLVVLWAFKEKGDYTRSLKRLRKAVEWKVNVENTVDNADHECNVTFRTRNDSQYQNLELKPSSARLRQKQEEWKWFMERNDRRRSKSAPRPSRTSK